jgi:hypothetical protein
MGRRGKKRKKLKRHAAGDEGAVRQAALCCGMELRVSYMRAGRNAKALYPHWRFVQGDREVLHYWPSSGTWWAPGGGGKGRAADGHEALLRARVLAGEAGPEAREELDLAERRWGL